MLVPDPRGRFTIEQCLSHPWITQLSPDGTDSTSEINEVNVDPRRRGVSTRRERTLLGLSSSGRQAGKGVIGAAKTAESSSSTTREMQRVSTRLPGLFREHRR